jgi:hypothetical protein
MHCKDDPIYVFPEMKLRGLVPNSHGHVSVSDFFRNEAAQFLFLEIFVSNFWHKCLCSVEESGEQCTVIFA